MERPKAATNKSGGWLVQENKSLDQHHPGPSGHPSSSEEGSFASLSANSIAASMTAPTVHGIQLAVSRSGSFQVFSNSALPGP
jgi:hypothetical protein